MTGFVTVIATVCAIHGHDCMEAVVADDVPSIECEYGEPALQDWFSKTPFMEMGWKLVGWRCEPKKTPT